MFFFLPNSPLVIVFEPNEDGSFWCLNKEGTTFRRLSTKSSVKGNGEHGLTYWKWYWQKSKDEWVEYEQWVCKSKSSSFLHEIYHVT